MVVEIILTQTILKILRYMYSQSYNCSTLPALSYLLIYTLRVLYLFFLSPWLNLLAKKLAKQLFRSSAHDKN